MSKGTLSSDIKEMLSEDKRILYWIKPLEFLIVMKNLASIPFQCFSFYFHLS